MKGPQLHLISSEHLELLLRLLDIFCIPHGLCFRGFFSLLKLVLGSVIVNSNLESNLIHLEDISLQLLLSISQGILLHDQNHHISGTLQNTLN